MPRMTALGCCLLAASMLGLTHVPRALAQGIEPSYTELGKLDGAVYTLLEAADGRHVLYHTADQELHAFDRATGTSRRIARLDGADPMISPRGDRVVFSKIAESGQDLWIWSLPLDPRTLQPRGAPRRVSRRTGRGAVFSPDGLTVAFTVIPPSEAAAPRIVALPAAGGPERVVAEQPGWAQNLSWSRDGRWIYYRYHERPAQPGARPTLMRVPSSGGAPQLLREVDDFLGISSDGALLAYYVPGSFEASRLTVGISTADGLEVGRFALPPDFYIRGWASGGRRLLATRERTTSEIRVTSSNGGRSRVLARDGFDGIPVWSPNGTHIAHRSLLDGRQRLAVANFADGSRRQVSLRHQPDQRPPVWSPDGRHLAFRSHSDDGVRLVVVDVAREVEAELARADQIHEISWRANGGSVRFVAERGTVKELREVTLGGRESLLRTVPESGGHQTLSVAFASDSIAVVATRAGITALPLRGEASRTLLTLGADETPEYFRVEVSPDGKWAAAPVSDASGESVRLLPLDGGPGRALRLPYLAHDGVFRWHPDGRHLVVKAVAKLQERHQAYLVPLNGDAPRPLTAEAGNLELQSFSISADGSTVAYEVATGTAAALWEIDLTNSMGALEARAGAKR